LRNSGQTLFRESRDGFREFPRGFFFCESQAEFFLAKLRGEFFLAKLRVSDPAPSPARQKAAFYIIQEIICQLRDWLFFAIRPALQLTDCSFEPPWGRAQAIPSPQQNACTGPWGLVRVRKPETEEPTMVKRAHLHSVSRIPRAVSARAPSGSASLTHLQITYLPPERLRHSPNNARTHSKKQLKQIASSIERFGFVNPVLISDDFQIIAGHGRVEAAKLLGLKKIPTVRLSNLSPADRRAYVITDNRLAELAGWDRELLASELQGLLELEFDDIELTGFSLGEIDLMLDEAADKKAEETGPEDELPANSLHDPAVSRAGDQWVLGPHRLLCGELDLLSCDVVVGRWQQYTGKAARLEGSDLTFADVKATRLAGQNASTSKSLRGRCHV
jgi:hypothetical protein